MSDIRAGQIDVIPRRHSNIRTDNENIFNDGTSEDEYNTNSTDYEDNDRHKMRMDPGGLDLQIICRGS